MSELTQTYIDYLLRLKESNRAAMAHLKRSLGFTLGGYPRSYPFVEPFVNGDRPAYDAQRLALYLTAGLFAMHPNHQTKTTFAAALGQLAAQRSDSIEKRFIALLSADPETVANYLRQNMALLASDDLGLNYATLLNDLTEWLNPYRAERHTAIKQRWARDFYRHYGPTSNHQS
ncbi:type I-E CRISPR-associated protein Cse2/CasB [Ectothiorhodospiraceae bacterium BW-2]|nr:type I-E CRISPR-associated protein Cse2/CasB [Ectothiorhodospiraceae bacterium BW-2]